MIKYIMTDRTRYIMKPELQRRHYKFIAHIVRTFLEQEGAHILFGDQLIDHVMSSLYGTNPSYNPSKFREACQPRGDDDE